MIKLVIANRGEIARRIMKAAKQRGFCVAVIATPDDKKSLVCREAHDILEVSSFLNAKEIVEKCKAYGAHLIHPGYGFLSENSEFAQLVEDAGMSFVGPTSANMKAMGSKESAKKMAQKCQVPTLNALLSHELKSTPVNNWKEALDAKGILSPYLVKASGGGGGRGMRVVEKLEDLENALHRASEEAQSAFHDDTVFVERYLKNPRHIEIQVFGDGQGGGVFWGERECSLQRRHQKVVEEAPSSFVDETFREKMGRASLALVKETKYRGAGTLEFLVDDQKNFYFLEMNTRLQVEHPVTEMVYGIDLVQAQFDLALGKWPEVFPSPHEFMVPKPNGVSIEVRVLAEDPKNNFMPTPGPIVFLKEPTGEGVRVDSGVETGDVVNPNFDSMIAKLIVHGPNRKIAVQKMISSLENFPILGFTSNLSFLKNIISHNDFLLGKESTGWIEENKQKLNESVWSKSIQELFASPRFQEKVSFLLDKHWTATPLENIFAMSSPGLTMSSPGLTRGTSFENFSGPILYTAARISLTQIQLFYLGESFVFSCPRRVNIQSSSQASDSGEIKTPMPGKLFEVLVKEGDKVSENQVLFIVESMKIQLEVKSPKNGAVEKIYFSKGQNLMSSDVLAFINSSVS